MGNSGVVSEKSGWSFRISGFFPVLFYLGLQYNTFDERSTVSTGWTCFGHGWTIICTFFRMGNSGVVSEKSGWSFRISGFFPFLAHLECTLDENDGVSVGHSFGREDTMQEVIIEVILSLQFLRKMSFSSIFFFF